MAADFKSGLLLGVACAAFAAAAPAWAQTRTFNVPSQDAVTGIPAFARQAGLQILVAESAAHGKRTQAVVGAYPTKEALARLLQGTGLSVASNDGRTVTLRPPASGGVDPGGAPAESVSVSEVLVTGSRLPPGKTDTIPVNTYTSETIARSGQINLTSFLNSLPEVSVGTSGDAFGLAGQTSVRLRGLPPGATLVLIDGRRVSPSAIQGSSAIFDLNAVSSDLLERLEIVPVGSSAIYGSDAIGGVVNIVLRKGFDGVGGSLTRSFADGYQTTGVAFAAGRRFERGSLSLIASFREQEGLPLSAREETATLDFSRYAQLGGSDRRPMFCDPGTVFAASGNLNGLGVNTAAIRPSGGVRPALADFAAGESNRCDTYYGQSNVIPAVRGPSGILSGELELTEGVRAYTQVFYSEYRTDNRRFGIPSTRVAVPASNAFNPFGQPVFVTTIWPRYANYLADSQVFRPLVGARGPLPRGWSWDAATWLNRTDDKLENHAQDAAALAAALASSDPTLALNPFRPGSNSADLLQRVFPRPTGRYHTRQEAADAVLRGPLLTLPAGTMHVAAGWEGSRDKVYRMLGSSGAVTSGKRSTASLFAQARVPLMAGPAADEPLLVADLAARADRYSDFGDVTTPQLALEGHPMSRLSLRAAYSKAFKAPTLLQLFAGQTFARPALFDPRLGVTVTPSTVLGGNPDLQPETGEATTFTATWRDPAFHNLRVSLTHFRISQDSRIVQISSQTLLNNEDLFPGRVTRGVPAAGATVGPVLDVDTRYVNFGGLRLAGLDVTASFDVGVAGGVLTPSLAMTTTLKYTSQLAPGQPFVDRLSKATMDDVWAPRYKATLAALWRRGGITGSAQARYVGRYLDHQTPANQNEVGDYWTFDASAEADLSDASLDRRWALDGVYLRVAVANLLDRGLRYSNYNNGSLGFDPTVDDFVGRNVTFTIGRRF